MCLAVQTIQGPPGEQKKRKGKRKAQRYIQKKEEDHSLAKNKHKILKCGQKRALLGGPKDAKARKDCQKAMMALRRVVFAFASQIKAQARITPRTKATESPQKGRGKKEPHRQSGLSASETSEEEGYSHSWESDDWSSCQWLDDSWTPAAGWFCTKAHTAWMAVRS